VILVVFKNVWLAVGGATPEWYLDSRHGKGVVDARPEIVAVPIFAIRAFRRCWDCRPRYA